MKINKFEDFCFIDLPYMTIEFEFELDTSINATNRRYWYFNDESCRYYGIDYDKRFNTAEHAISYVKKRLKIFSEKLAKSIKEESYLKQRGIQK